jgi:hypothetical protein
MAFPAQTFSTIGQLIAYINTYIIPNGLQEIDGTEHNNVENALANFIVSYTLNSPLATLINSTAPYSLATPITVFAADPTSVSWPDNLQNEYYIVNATANNIALQGGFSFIDAFQVPQTFFPARAAIHIAKATNGQWIQVNNLGGSASGLPPQPGHQGQVLFTQGSTAFWGDEVLQIAAADPNWVNGTTWQNGFSVNNPSFSSPHFLLFWNDINRFLLQNSSPAEWQYVSNGFQVLLPGWDAQAQNVNLFLFFKGANS